MLFAIVLGIMLGVVGTTLVRQWLQGALVEVTETRALPASEFPRLAPPVRVRRPAVRAAATHEFAHDVVRPASFARRAA